MKRLLGGLTAALFIVLALVGPTLATQPGSDGQHQVWVCKYVGAPGDFETLKAGKNPIIVDVAAADAYIGADFADGQTHSYVIDLATDANTGQGETYIGDKTCPTPTPSSSPSVEPSETPEPSASPSSSPSATPSETPSSTPSATPSATPSTAPSEAPSTPAVTPTPTSSDVDTGGGEPGTTPPPTDTIVDAALTPDGSNALVILAVAAALFIVAVTFTRKARR